MSKFKNCLTAQVGFNCNSLRNLREFHSRYTNELSQIEDENNLNNSIIIRMFMLCCARIRETKRFKCVTGENFEEVCGCFPYTKTILVCPDGKFPK